MYCVPAKKKKVSRIWKYARPHGFFYFEFYMLSRYQVIKVISTMLFVFYSNHGVALFLLGEHVEAREHAKQE